MGAANEIGQHRDELRMVVHGGGAMKREPDTVGHPARLDVEVVQHLHVIAHETDRHDDGVALAVRRQPSQDVGVAP